MSRKEITQEAQNVSLYPSADFIKIINLMKKILILN